MTPRALAVAAALLVACGIAAGAFGAHGVADARAAEWLRTAALYAMVHGVAALALGARFVRASWTMLGGAALFAGTLVAMAMGAPRWLGAVTPVGGLALIAGWLGVAWSAARTR